MLYHKFHLLCATVGIIWKYQIYFDTQNTQSFYLIERRLNLTLYRKSYNEITCILNKISNATSAHVRLLPEFKHINEGRKRN
jgi:hypothetical protein